MDAVLLYYPEVSPMFYSVKSDISEPTDRV